MRALAPVSVAHLFPELHQALMDLLRGLRPEDWDRPTVAKLWTVRDVTAHLLDSELRRLTFHRDGLAPRSRPTEGQDLLGFLNELNATWVRAADRIGPKLLVDFLAVTGPQLAAFFAPLDPKGRASFPVAWAGESESENWFDLGREYTEHWHHQQQIREAVGAPLLSSPRFLAPVLDLSVRCLPHTYRATAAPKGATIVFEVRGESGGAWCLYRDGQAWRLYAGEPDAATSRVSLDEDTAWRLFFKALSDEDAAARVRMTGDLALGRVALGARAVMV